MCFGGGGVLMERRFGGGGVFLGDLPKSNGTSGVSIQDAQSKSKKLKGSPQDGDEVWGLLESGR